MVKISHRHHALFLFSSSTSCHHRHVFFGSLQCEENLDSTLCGSFSGNGRMESFMTPNTTFTLNICTSTSDTETCRCLPTRSWQSTTPRQDWKLYLSTSSMVCIWVSPYWMLDKYNLMARSLGRTNCVWVRPAPWEVPHLLSYCQGCWQHSSTHQVWSRVV